MISLKRLKTGLIASALFVSGCNCAPKPPEVFVRQILQRLNKCKVYKVEFGDKMTFNFEKDIPLEECLIEGDFVITDSELVDIRQKYEAAKKCYEETCKK